VLIILANVVAKRTLYQTKNDLIFSFFSFLTVIVKCIETWYIAF